jgi:predicted DNA-binding transcriptional regulator YafY
MSKRETLLRYSAIIRCVSNAPVTLNEINACLKRESDMHGFDLSVSKRTFQRDVQDLLSLFQIEIVYDYSLRKYLIRNQGDESYNSRILEAFETISVLTVNRDISQYLEFETRRAGGLDNFHGLLHAVKNHLQLNFSYKSYDQEKASLRKTNPLLLKEFKGRWYIIAKDLADDKIKTYALDRLSDPEITKKRFALPSNFDPKLIFRDSFGIIHSVAGSVPQRIILSFDPWQGKYVKSQPLHSSQVILIDSNTEFRIELFVYVAFDLVKELLSYGSGVKVIEPINLAKEIMGMQELALKQYKDS